MKRRSLTLVVCLLATLSLASVGFAAWVISAGDIEQMTGSFLVEDVTDERYEIRNLSVDGVEWNHENSSWTGGNAPEFVFGKNGAVTTYNWLKNTTSEKLTLVVKFKVYHKADNTEVTTLDKITIANTFSATGLTKGSNEYARVVAASPTAEYKEGYWTFEIELAWGSYFAEGKNPFEYYNGQEITDALAEEAKLKLETMYTDTASASYTLKIDVQPKA